MSKIYKPVTQQYSPFTKSNVLAAVVFISLHYDRKTEAKRNEQRKKKNNYKGADYRYTDGSITGNGSCFTCICIMKKNQLLYYTVQSHLTTLNN